jgi:DNA mismatch repair ATPase MutS
MKVWLMHEGRDFDPHAALPANVTDMEQDLGLEVLFETMAAGEPFLWEVSRQAVLGSMRDPAAILYRQEILVDAMAYPDVVRQLYTLSVEAIEREKHVWGWMTTRYPNDLLHRSVEVLQIFAGILARLRQVADAHASAFHSKGFGRLFAMLQSALDDDYLSRVNDHLERLAFRGGVLMSAELGPLNKAKNYVLRKPPEAREGLRVRMQEWIRRFARDADPLTYEVAERDEAGFNALNELKTEGIVSVATALAQSTDHILSFFRVLQLELGFYVGCLNLCDRLAAKGEEVCIPQIAGESDAAMSGNGLYDPSLALSMESPVVPNDLAADGKHLVIMTGANRGGKSTFLRAIGLAQLMAQCGMFVAARSFRTSLCPGLFTHFKREEDAAMKSGKLDEELARMSSVVDYLKPHVMVLLNESFASTNEREGSEIGRQVVHALLEMEIRVFYVTHMFDLASSFHSEDVAGALFLRAERLPNGERTFRLCEGAPLPTSHGEDLYRIVFAEAAKSKAFNSWVRATRITAD